MAFRRHHSFLRSTVRTRQFASGNEEPAVSAKRVSDFLLRQVRRGTQFVVGTSVVRSIISHPKATFAGVYLTSCAYTFFAVADDETYFTLNTNNATFPR